MSFAFITYFKKERRNFTAPSKEGTNTVQQGKIAAECKENFMKGWLKCFFHHIYSWITTRVSIRIHQLRKKKLQNHFLFWKKSTELGCGGYCMVSTRFWLVFHGFRLVLLGSTQFLFIIKAEHFTKFLLTRYFCLLFEKWVNILILSKMKRNLSICFSGILPRKSFITNPLNESFWKHQKQYPGGVLLKRCS